MSDARASDALELTGHLLIAMPSMGDMRFEHSVVYICTHSDEGAMGLIVNKPSVDLTVARLLEQLDIDGAGQGGGRFDAAPVHFGGPVETGRGFVLHSDDYRSNLQSLTMGDGLAMTATLDILEAMARGQGPEQALMALGYAGWGPGQLEGEIAQNGWLTVPATRDLVFACANEDKWSQALALLGITPLMLSGDAGHA
ncbi:MAG: YqgE/AlgH family protein [Marinibacterium sp.]|nr:YqgE/AlgH family protein [Marinibacterium sp.]